MNAIGQGKRAKLPFFSLPFCFIQASNGWDDALFHWMKVILFIQFNNPNASLPETLLPTHPETMFYQLCAFSSPVGLTHKITTIYGPRELWGEGDRLRKDKG